MDLRIISMRSGELRAFNTSRNMRPAVMPAIIGTRGEISVPTAMLLVGLLNQSARVGSALPKKYAANANGTSGM